MILADTSAWVEFDRATGSPIDLRLTALIEQDGALAVTEPVLMEVLAGARDEERAIKLRRLLLRCELLSVEPSADFEGAARIYRRCRAAGLTPRGPVDCLIVAVAGRRGATLLAADVDLIRIASVLGLPLDDGTPRIR